MGILSGLFRGNNKKRQNLLKVKFEKKWVFLTIAKIIFTNCTKFKIGLAQNISCVPHNSQGRITGLVYISYKSIFSFQHNKNFLLA